MIILFHQFFLLNLSISIKSTEFFVQKLYKNSKILLYSWDFIKAFLFLTKGNLIILTFLFTVSTLYIHWDYLCIIQGSAAITITNIFEQNRIMISFTVFIIEQHVNIYKLYVWLSQMYYSTLEKVNWTLKKAIERPPRYLALQALLLYLITISRIDIEVQTKINRASFTQKEIAIIYKESCIEMKVK